MITTNYLWKTQSQPDGIEKNIIFKITVLTASYGSQFENFLSCYIGTMQYGKRNGCSEIEFKSENSESNPSEKVQTELASVAKQLGFILAWT